MWDLSGLLSTMVQKKFVPMPYISEMILKLCYLIWIQSWQSLCPLPCHSAMVHGCLADSVLQFVGCFQHSLKYPFIKANPTIPNHKSSHPEPRAFLPCKSRPSTMVVFDDAEGNVHDCPCILPYPVCMLMFKNRWSYPRGDGSLVWTSKKVQGSNPLECRWKKLLQKRWSEPAVTSAPVQDEAVQAILGMNRKHIRLCPRFLVCSASSLPPKLFPPTYLTSFCTHSIVMAWESLKREGRRGRAKRELKGKLPPISSFFFVAFLRGVVAVNQ